MMALDPRVSDIISRNCLDAFGMTFDEFSKLSVCEQQRLLEENRRKNKKKNKKKYIPVMIGYGEHSTFIKAKKGEKVMIRYGNIIEAGLTPEEERQRLEDSLDDIIYSKPVAFIKKLSRKIKNR